LLVYDVVVKDLPPLKIEVARLLNKLSDPDESTSL
jgi:hypothetical protein